jgi:hypothetical protein
VEYQGSQNTMVIGMYFYYQYYKMWHVWDSHKLGWIEIHLNAVVRDLFGPLRQSDCKQWNLHSIGSQLLEVFLVETRLADVQFSLVASVLLYASAHRSCPVSQYVIRTHSFMNIHQLIVNYGLLHCDAVYFRWLPLFWRNVSLISVSWRQRWFMPPECW